MKRRKKKKGASLNSYQMQNYTSLHNPIAKTTSCLNKVMIQYIYKHFNDIQILLVLNVLYNWTTYHFYDFKKDKSLCVKLKKFVDSIRDKKLQKRIPPVYIAIPKVSDMCIIKPENIRLAIFEHNRASRAQRILLAQQPIYYVHALFKELFAFSLGDCENKFIVSNIFVHEAKQKGERRHYDETHDETDDDDQSMELHILDPLKFAQQLTNMLSNIFKKIESVESVDAGWTTKEKEEYSPNLIKMSTYETKEISVKRRVILKELEQIDSADNQFKKYKAVLKAIDPQCIPFLGKCNPVKLNL
uniref:Ras-GEF domain-containing protein n=1 Tax=Amphimedon queenslandica TaxID=400682 RepID=A0A1X7UZR0_AMPQE